MAPARRRRAAAASPTDTSRVVVLADLVHHPQPLALHREHQQRASAASDKSVHDVPVYAVSASTSPRTKPLALERAGEPGSGQLPDCAIRAVGAHEIRRRGLFQAAAGVPQLGLDAIRPRGKAHELGPPVDAHAQSGQALGEHPFGLGLGGQQREREPAGHVAEPDSGRSPFPPSAAAFRAIRTPVPSSVPATPIRSIISRLLAWMAIARDSVVGAVSFVDDPYRISRRASLAGEHQAHWAGADDDDRLVHGTPQIAMWRTAA